MTINSICRYCCMSPVGQMSPCQELLLSLIWPCVQTLKPESYLTWGFYYETTQNWKWIWYPRQVEMGGSPHGILLNHLLTELLLNTCARRPQNCRMKHRLLQRLDVASLCSQSMKHQIEGALWGRHTLAGPEKMPSNLRSRGCMHRGWVKERVSLVLMPSP